MDDFLAGVSQEDGVISQDSVVSQEGDIDLHEATQTELLELIEKQKKEIKLRDAAISELVVQLQSLRGRVSSLEKVTPLVTGTSVTLTDSIPIRTTPNVTFCTSLTGTYMSAKAAGPVKFPVGFEPINGISSLRNTKEEYSQLGLSQEGSAVLMDVSSSADDDTEGSDETEDGSLGVTFKRNTEMRELADLLAGRSAPKPEPYSLDAGRSFNRFLDSFEAYCSSRYSRKQKSLWTPELGRFLKEEALQVYRACGGPDQSYKYMKRKLQDWYASVKVRVSSSRKSLYETARPLDGEGLRIFATRLEHLYRKAYPNKSLDGKDLKRRLVDALPKKVVNGLERDLALLRAANNRQNTWNDVLVLLEAQDEAFRRGTNSSETQNFHTAEPWAGVQSIPRNMKVIAPVKGSNYERVEMRTASPSKSPRAVRRCNWCKKPGHVYDNCRRRLNQCLRCGDTDHFVRNCPSLKQSMTKNVEASGRRASSSSSSEAESNRRGRSLTRRHHSRTFRRSPLNKDTPLNSNPLV